MNLVDYQRVLRDAHGLRLAARELAAAGLDAAIDAIARAETLPACVLDATLYRAREAAMREDEVTLRAVRVLARLGVDESLTGEDGEADQRGGGSPRSSAPRGETAVAQRGSSPVETCERCGGPSRSVTLLGAALLATCEDCVLTLACERLAADEAVAFMAAVDGQRSGPAAS